MRKVLSFVCILGLSALASAKGLKGTPDAQCTLSFYGPPSDPVCNTYVDENGQEQTECYAVGPAASAAIVDKSNKNLKVADGNVYELDFDGTCDCNLVLYSKANYKGQSKKYAFSKAENKQIFADQIWNKENASFKVLCNF